MGKNVYKKSFLTYLKVLSNEKEGDVIWYQSIGIWLIYISAIFLVFFKEPLLFKLWKKIGFSICMILVTVWLDRATLRFWFDKM